MRHHASCGVCIGCRAEIGCISCMVAQYRLYQGLHHQGNQNDGDDRNDAEEECADQCHLREALANIIRGRLTGTAAKNGTAVLLQVIRHLNRVEGNLNIEVGEGDDENEQKNGIDPSVALHEVVEGLPESGSLFPAVWGSYARKRHDRRRKRDDGGGEDDGHNTRHIELKRQIL